MESKTKTWTVAAKELALTGPLISVEIGHPESRDFRMGKALIDTGAMCTLVSPHIVSALGLTQRGVGKGRGVDGPVSEKPYFAVIFRQPDLDLECEVNVMAVDNVNGPDVICLLGRDVLYDLSFSMGFDGPNGSYSLTWK
jgi:hypothetical protein